MSGIDTVAAPGPRAALCVALAVIVSLLTTGNGQALEPDLVPAVVPIPAGPFIRGSDRTERELAYQLDEYAYGHDATRRQRWYEAEYPRGPLELKAYGITRTPITNRQYAAFVAATGNLPPDVDPETWAGTA